MATTEFPRIAELRAYTVEEPTGDGGPGMSKKLPAPEDDPGSWIDPRPVHPDAGGGPGPPWPPIANPMSVYDQWNGPRSTWSAPLGHLVVEVIATVSLRPCRPPPRAAGSSSPRAAACDRWPGADGLMVIRDRMAPSAWGSPMQGNPAAGSWKTTSPASSRARTRVTSSSCGESMLPSCAVRRARTSFHAVVAQGSDVARIHAVRPQRPAHPRAERG